jgi:hypothetical protein
MERQLHQGAGVLPSAAAMTALPDTPADTE